MHALKKGDVKSIAVVCRALLKWALIVANKPLTSLDWSLISFSDIAAAGLIVSGLRKLYLYLKKPEIRQKGG